jgi:DNA-binding transcriptional MerR regulator
MTGDGDLLTVTEVSARLRTPAGTLRYWRAIGRGPVSFKVGRRVVYRESAVVAYLTQQQMETSSGLRSPLAGETS